MRKYLAAFVGLLALAGQARAADSTVSALTAAGALGGTDLFYVVQGGADRKATPAQVDTYVRSLMGTGISTWLNTPSSANLAAAVTDETGSGALVFATSPTLVTPNLGTPSAAVLTNATGYPVANLTGAGTGVLAALAASLNSSTGAIGALTPTNNNCVVGNGTAWTSASCPASAGGAIQPVSGTSATVPAMTAGAAVADTDLFYCAQSSGTTDRKCTGAQVKTYAATSAVRATTTTSEALANSDQGKLVTFSNASAVACTIAQAGSGGNFTAGWAASLKNLGAGTVTCTPTTSTVDGAAAFILLPGQGLDLYSDGTNYFTQGGRGTIVAKGTLALATSAISSAACTSAQTLTATGVTTTDIVLASFNGDPTAVTGYVPLTSGMLTIIVYPTANTINVKVCNNTSASITPGAITLNLSAVR